MREHPPGVDDARKRTPNRPGSDRRHRPAGAWREARRGRPDRPGRLHAGLADHHQAAQPRAHRRGPLPHDGLALAGLRQPHPRLVRPGPHDLHRLEQIGLHARTDASKSRRVDVRERPSGRGERRQPLHRDHRPGQRSRADGQEERVARGLARAARRGRPLLRPVRFRPAPDVHGGSRSGQDAD